VEFDKNYIIFYTNILISKSTLFDKQKQKYYYLAEVTIMSTELTQTNRYQELLATNGLTQNIKHFEGLYTQIAVSESGYIAI